MTFEEHCSPGVNVSLRSRTLILHRRETNLSSKANGSTQDTLSIPEQKEQGWNYHHTWFQNIRQSNSNKKQNGTGINMDIQFNGLEKRPRNVPTELKPSDC